ncbi:MAG TPA: zf-HC2 domain-containing protein, partial [Longimicrobiaceae bacterium]|nr:zf-HC2 domain-containing protein [Longimicrobiaceae bacterium]
MKHTDEGALQALLDGELTPAQAAGVEAHLASCSACAAELEGLRAARGRLSSALALADAVPPMLATRA